jgi:hypothetical protein
MGANRMIVEADPDAAPFIAVWERASLMSMMILSMLSINPSCLD